MNHLVFVCMTVSFQSWFATVCPDSGAAGGRLHPAGVQGLLGHLEELLATPPLAGLGSAHGVPPGRPELQDVDLNSSGSDSSSCSHAALVSLLLRINCDLRKPAATQEATCWWKVLYKVCFLHFQLVLKIKGRMLLLCMRWGAGGNVASVLFHI